MRLICPNCDAEYEVDDSAIPDTGRDVQCSNCGHAWFQLPPEIELALEQEDELFGQAAAEAVAEPPAPPATPAAAATTAEPTAAPTPAASGEDVPAPAPAAAVAAEPPRRTLDENLMAILREEAEREAAARRSEGSVIETQPDLGLAAPPPASPSASAAAPAALSEAARRVAQLQGKDPDIAARPAARRDLLPDIEEINSSLKGNELPPEMVEDLSPAAAAAEARGFRSGFALSLFLAVILLAAYVAAPQIKAQIPALSGGLDAYVAGVDGLRLWLDGVLRSATDTVRGMTANETGGAGG